MDPLCCCNSYGGCEFEWRDYWKHGGICCTCGGFLNCCNATLAVVAVFVLTPVAKVIKWAVAPVAVMAFVIVRAAGLSTEMDISTLTALVALADVYDLQA